MYEAAFSAEFWLPQLYFEGLEMCAFCTFILHLKCVCLHIPKDIQSSLISAGVELPGHAETWERSSSVLHRVFQNHIHPQRIMPGAKHKQKVTALVKADMVQVV